MKETSLDPGRCKTNPFLSSGDLIKHGFGNKADSFASIIVELLRAGRKRQSGESAV